MVVVGTSCVDSFPASDTAQVAAGDKVPLLVHQTDTLAEVPLGESREDVFLDLEGETIKYGSDEWSVPDGHFSVGRRNH